MRIAPLVLGQCSAMLRLCRLGLTVETFPSFAAATSCGNCSAGRYASGMGHASYTGYTRYWEYASYTGYVRQLYLHQYGHKALSIYERRSKIHLN
jgi:hypothetical protein